MVGGLVGLLVYLDCCTACVLPALDLGVAASWLDCLNSSVVGCLVDWLLVCLFACGLSVGWSVGHLSVRW